MCRKLAVYVVSAFLVLSCAGLLTYAQEEDASAQECAEAFGEVYAMNPPLFGQRFAQNAIGCGMSDARKASALASFLFQICGATRSPAEMYMVLNPYAQEIAIATTHDIADATSNTLRARMDNIARLKAILGESP